jgi:hypothetical protein
MREEALVLKDEVDLIAVAFGALCKSKDITGLKAVSEGFLFQES